MTLDSWLMVAILGTTFGMLIFTLLPPAAITLICEKLIGRPKSLLAAGIHSQTALFLGEPKSR